MITNYSSLQSEIASYLDRTDLTEEIKTWIQIAEIKAYRVLRIPVMEVATSQDTGASTGKITIPSNFLELKSMAVIDGDNVVNLRRKAVNEVRCSTRTGVPKYFARLGTEWIFEPAPDAQYNVDIFYYGQLDALSDSNNQNYFTQSAPDVLLFGALAEGFFYLQDFEEAGRYRDKFNQALKDTQAMSDNSEWAGTPIQGA